MTQCAAGDEAYIIYLGPQRPSVLGTTQILIQKLVFSQNYVPFYILRPFMHFTCFGVFSGM